MIDLDFLDRYQVRIAQSRERIEKFWRLEVQSEIPTSVYVPGFYSIEKGMLCTREQYFTDKETNLDAQLQSIRSHLKSLDDVYLPHLETYIGTPVIASAFGGRIRYFENQDPWIESHVIHEYKDIDRLKKPNPLRVGLAGKIIEWVEYWKQATHDRLPLSITDMQGPLSVAIDLMGADKFYLGLYDDPKRIKLLLEMISEVFIEFCNTFSSRIETEGGVHEWTGIFFPKDRGRCRLSEDNLVSVSTDMYREFLMPYNELILRSIGGGLIHWCGDGSVNFDNVLATDALTGVHNSSMGDFELILNQIDRVAGVNAARGSQIVYFNAMKLPSNAGRVAELLERQKSYGGVANCLFLPLDGFGLDLDDGQSVGYRKMEQDPLDVIRTFTGGPDAKG